MRMIFFVCWAKVPTPPPPRDASSSMQRASHYRSGAIQLTEVQYMPQRAWSSRYPRIVSVLGYPRMSNKSLTEPPTQWNLVSVATQRAKPHWRPSPAVAPGAPAWAAHASCCIPTYRPPTRPLLQLAPLAAPRRTCCPWTLRPGKRVTLGATAPLGPPPQDTQHSQRAMLAISAGRRLPAVRQGGSPQWHGYGGPLCFSAPASWQHQHEQQQWVSSSQVSQPAALHILDLTQFTPPTTAIAFLVSEVRPARCTDTVPWSSR
jgi:hypothetical protein